MASKQADATIATADGAAQALLLQAEALSAMALQVPSLLECSPDLQPEL
jgi:hypothetical protein